MRTGHNESNENEKQRYSQENHYTETLVRKPVQISNIPPRASAHPSAIAAVRPKYPRRVSDQQPVTPFDGLGDVGMGLAPTRNPAGLTNSAASRKRTDDILIDRIFRDVEDCTPIDEIATFPADVPARHRPRLERAEYELATLSQVNTLPTSSVRGKQEEVPQRVETRLWSATRFPSGVGQTVRPQQGFSIEQCFDNVRWWLLSPGRLEFLLWCVGAILLVGLTSVFLLVLLTVWMR